jgi:hypothetical protein
VQAIDVGAVQTPAPLQRAAVVALLLAQDAAAPQETVVAGYTQAARFEPSQCPAQVPVPVQAVRGVVTATQVPFALALLHASHCPPQATLQQIPSAQTPVAHSVPATQVSPPLRATHVPLLQTGVLPVHPPQQVAFGTQPPLQALVMPVHTIPV